MLHAAIQALETFDLGNGIKLEMVLIPSGKFLMGSKLITVANKISVIPDDEQPQHEVTISKDFYLGKFEVTQEQWQAVKNKNPSQHKGANKPVDSVTWNACQEFIEKLNTKTGYEFRLPTEAEWEYACKANTKTNYSCGDALSFSNANILNIKPQQSFAVGTFKPNAFGLYDMHGNVWEWCNDWHGNYSNEPQIDPTGPPKGPGKILRGGSYHNDAWNARSSYRGFNLPTTRNTYKGFRLAKTK